VIKSDNIQEYLNNILNKNKFVKIIKKLDSTIETNNVGILKNKIIYISKFKIKQFRNSTYTEEITNRFGIKRIEENYTIYKFAENITHLIFDKLEIEYESDKYSRTIYDNIGISIHFSNHKTNIIGNRGNINFMQISVSIPVDENDPIHGKLKQKIRNNKIDKLLKIK